MRSAKINLLNAVNYSGVRSEINTMYESSVIYNNI